MSMKINQHVRRRTFRIIFVVASSTICGCYFQPDTHTTTRSVSLWAQNLTELESQREGFLTRSRPSVLCTRAIRSLVAHGVGLDNHRPGRVSTLEYVRAPEGKHSGTSMSITSSDRAVVLLASLSAFVDALSYSFLIPFAPTALQNHFGVEQDVERTVALLYTTFSIAALVSLPATGWFVSYNCRIAFLMSAACLVGASIMLALATDLRTLFAARACQGVASAGNWTASLAMLAEHFPAGKLGGAWARYSCSRRLGLWQAQWWVGPCTTALGRPWGLLPSS